jgi:hypothetical protein
MLRHFEFVMMCMSVAGKTALVLSQVYRSANTHHAKKGISDSTESIKCVLALIFRCAAVLLLLPLLVLLPQAL